MWPALGMLGELRVHGPGLPGKSVAGKGKVWKCTNMLCPAVQGLERHPKGFCLDPVGNREPEGDMARCGSHENRGWKEGRQEAPGRISGSGASFYLAGRPSSTRDTDSSSPSRGRGVPPASVASSVISGGLCSLPPPAL